MGLNFEVSTSNPIFFERFLVGVITGKNRNTTIKEVFSSKMSDPFLLLLKIQDRLLTYLQERDDV